MRVENETNGFGIKFQSRNPIGWLKSYVLRVKSLNPRPSLYISGLELHRPSCLEIPSSAMAVP